MSVRSVFGRSFVCVLCVCVCVCVVCGVHTCFFMCCMHMLGYVICVSHFCVYFVVFVHARVRDACADVRGHACGACIRCMRDRI